MAKLIRAGLLTGLLMILASCTSNNVGGLPGPNTDSVDPVIDNIGGVTDGGTVSGTVDIDIEASDNTAVTILSLRIDGEEVAAATDGTLSFSWDTTEETNESHELVVTARDAAGNSATRSIDVTVNNVAGADTEDPVITGVTGVSEGGTVSGTVAITATATDNVAVTGFSLTLDGTEVDDEADGSLEFSWDTTAETDGAKVLVFTASDAAGNTAGQTINVTVDNSGPAPAGSVSGIVYAPNGTDPVSGATVSVQGEEQTTTSNADGSFDLTDVPTGEQTIIIEKGAFEKEIDLTVAEGDNPLNAEQTTLSNEFGDGDGEGILVVTGQFDVIQNVLAKLGLGEVSGGVLVHGTETFDMVDGDESLPDSAAYPNFDDFITTPGCLDPYRTVFLNCGNIYEEAFFADTDAVNRLRDWVEGGGKLYVTDWSYDFAEQLWPEQVDFASFTAGDGFSTTPEPKNEAQSGEEIETLDCTIEDAGLSAWMTSVGASEVEGHFPAIDWLIAWAAIEDVSESVKVWATGNVTYGLIEPQTTGVRPVTISFTEGTGTVLFSSYHAEETPSNELTPQERVLQYLIFEIL